jgi:hypothetical protein
MINSNADRSASRSSVVLLSVSIALPSFDFVDEAAVERLKTHVCQALDEGDNRLHSIRFLFEDEQVHAFRFYSPAGESARSERCGKVFSNVSFANGYHM